MRGLSQRRVDSLLLVVVFGILALAWAIGWTGARERDRAVLGEERTPETVVVDPGTPPPASPLQSAMSAPMAHRDRATAGPARVIDIASPRCFWAEAGGQIFLVCMSQAVDPVERLGVGDTVQVSGIVKTPASTSESEALGADDLRIVQTVTDYVLATDVAVP